MGMNQVECKWRLYLGGKGKGVHVIQVSVCV